MEHFVLYSTKDIDLGIVSCTFNHCMQIVALPESKVMSDAGHMESALVTKQKFRCKHYGRRLEVLNERYKCAANLVIITEIQEEEGCPVFGLPPPLSV